ncbi:hypothetical protein F5883DRAFT_698904 [Diaporthe sp. PMI_573]|nr:hypothetical protein F5883DRAFT_698904 [Diaporthaceae sp. PMI_573]
MSSSTANTYRQYKQGTEAVFKWLLESMNKLGITIDRRLEDASIRTLLDLASRAQSKGASMPHEVLYALEDALKIRRQYHAWYSSQLSQSSPDGDNKHIEQSNEAHAAFIDVLQIIHDLFAPAKPRGDQPQLSTPSDKKILEITNLFANLEAEDVTEESAHAPMAKPSSGAEQTAKPWMMRKSQALIEDKLLELYCLFNDASKIRGYLRKKWAEYASRKLDIISAAMITQEALELFSEAEKSFEEKYGTIPVDDPDCPHPKHLDIIYHFAIGEPMTSTYTWEKYTSMSAAEIEAAKRRAQSSTEDRQRRIAELGWQPSHELDLWLMRPAVCVLEKFLTKVLNKGGDAWVLKQACRTPADRADALNALEFDEGLDCLSALAARELLSTFIDVYAGMMFIQRNPGVFMTPPDIITSLWRGKYDCSIRMVLSMQILHDVRTAKPDSGQLDILTQVSEDYKRLGGDLALYSQSFDKTECSPLVYNQQFQKAAHIERSWLQGRVPGQIDQLNGITKAESQKLSTLPLVMNPVLAGMILFGLSFRGYSSHVSYTNKKWFLIPVAHLLNWLAVRARGAKADFRDLWPDLHTALSLMGPRPVWVGNSPPETLEKCRNRILLAWGLQLNDFFQRIVRGDIPKAEELFRKIKNNTNDRNKLTAEQIGSLLNNEVQPSSFVAKWKSNERLSHPLKIETSQCTPLLDAVQENLESSSSCLMNAQQNHIRKIVLASGSKRKSREELDMLSYLDAFSRAARAEMPRLIFPYQEVTQQCGGLSIRLFHGARNSFNLSSEIWECVTLDELKNLKPTDNGEKLGSGAQSVSSLLALATIFGDRADRCPIEHLMLNFIEKDWDKETKLLSRDNFTKKFVEKCKEFGFAVPECVTTALP